MRTIIIWLFQWGCHHHYLWRYDKATKRAWLECATCGHETKGWDGVTA